ncbi:dynamin family protein [Campylobacter hepaticus]|uniref:dynamin family protein n=1 Tax=Campylobacter hepaticus TaxID=1813019 RepID=UPI0029B15EB8|nr:dynamin family protein [Campylobacter hepaticus]MDX2331087.1 dynamin family protein [Campylobacter hepaticus]MDX2371588.1 dynamin family protein [Campylobacter hepaticus]MDX2396952.1 dynamin family protein [Campylobacter hepaticus]MDX5508746.1 dynamin family protein [Campylobacter hepaticus]
MKQLLEKIWKNELQFLDFNLKFENKDKWDIAYYAIILSINKDNYERYFRLKEFKKLCKTIALRVDIFNIQKTQICILNLFKEGFIPKSNLIKALKILEKISDNTFLLDFILKQQIPSIDQKVLFQNNFKELNAINLELQKLSFDKNITLRLQDTLKKFQNLEFNIAITGIMNAGKSSFLNALLKEDLLGVSNIPETANLTLLNYGESEEAKIYFWNKAEWSNILENCTFNIELKEIITKLCTQVNINDFIQDESLVQAIKLCELKNFSSAKNKISTLIKKIEIKSNLEFLKNNISIVDTPGLDDVVIQREIITKEYLKESDLLIHLMNVTQSLTQKDMDFLVDCLLNSRLSKFLIILTKADLLNKEDLEEVIIYVKESLKSKLTNLNTNLVEKIDFLCVSAKMASDFYKGLGTKENLDKSGMQEFEQYLFNELYSGQKSKTILQAYKKQLRLELKNILDKYEIQNQIIKESQQGLSEKNQQLLFEFQTQTMALKEAQNDILDSIVRLKNIDSGINNLILLLAKKIKERLIDEFKYLKNNAKKLNIKRLMSIIDITTKDGINDILREIKFENIKKIEEIKNGLILKYTFLKDDLKDDFENFKDEVSKNIENIFKDEQFTLLKLKIEKLSNLNLDLYDLETRLNALIFDTFKEFKIEEILNSLDINGTFFNFLNDKLKHYEYIQKSKFENIEQFLKVLENENIDIVNSFKQNLEKIQKLKQLELGLLNAY